MFPTEHKFKRNPGNFFRKTFILQADDFKPESRDLRNKSSQFVVHSNTYLMLNPVRIYEMGDNHMGR
jgi:hypothetical protein